MFDVGPTCAPRSWRTPSSRRCASSPPTSSGWRRAATSSTSASPSLRTLHPARWPHGGGRAARGQGPWSGRAERTVWSALEAHDDVNPLTATYLNRLQRPDVHSLPRGGRG
ncbi:hypothetical protein [Streptosporangium longisporum]|uniref:hypothetical protein n=1 Tax=Streptosporangium longisporum TaxID=46187 RepID=UPI003CD07928